MFDLQNLTIILSTAQTTIPIPMKATNILKNPKFCIKHLESIFIELKLGFIGVDGVKFGNNQTIAESGGTISKPAN